MLILALSLAIAGSVEAQRPRVARQQPAAGGRGALEQRFQERLATVMRERLGLNEDQVRRLGDVNRRFESQRRELFQSEREIRIGMRKALSDSAANNDEVAGLMDRAIRLQRQRVDLLEAEQRELALFLTPVQRAKYFGLQEQIRRQMEEMRDRRFQGRGPDTGRGERQRPTRPPGR
jgi:hypothetical protein